MSNTRLTAIAGRKPGLVGGILALGSLPIHLLISEAHSIGMAAVILGLVAGVYVGFAVQDGRPGIFATEAVVAVGFIGAALAGLWISPWFVPAAYVAHGFWDLAHHRHVGTALPRWYVPFCAVYDWVFAAGLTAIWSGA